MTLPNCITFLRLFLVPVFGLAIIYYHKSVENGTPIEKYWVLAVSLFILASVSDALDGFIARYFNMKSRLGTFLDPLADKALLLSGFFVLSFVKITGVPNIPIWFPLLILAKDILLISAVWWARFHIQFMEVKPHWTSKISTFLQMSTIVSALFRISSLFFKPLLYLTTFFIIISTIVYIFQGLRLLRKIEKDDKRCPT